MPLPKKRQIVLSAKRRSWRMMDSHADEHDKRYHQVRDQILKRDEYSCVFCLFRSMKYQHIHHLDDDHGNNKPTNLVTACPLCHGCFHLGMTGIRKAGVMVWLPEIPQADLNNLCRAIFVAVQNNGEHEQAARSLYVSLESRAAVLETELGAGSSNPAAFGQAFLHMSEENYAKRAKMMGPVRLLPRMQAFGTEIAFWQTDASAFGAIADPDWSRVAPELDTSEVDTSNASDPSDTSDTSDPPSSGNDPLLKRLAGAGDGFDDETTSDTQD